MVIGEDGTVLRPVDKVARSGNTQAGQLMVPTRIGHYVESVLGHADTRVFATAWNVEVRPLVSTGIEDRSTMMLEVNAIFAIGITDAGCARANALRYVVFGAIEKSYASVDDSRSWIERLAVLPLCHPTPHRAKEAAGRIRSDDWVCSRRTLEAKPGPTLFCIGNLLCL